MNMARRLRFRDFRAAGASCHFAVPRLTDHGPTDPHWHDFVEVFWVDSGRGTHWINGRAVRAESGMLVFVAADDRHTFGAERGGSLTLVNVAFEASSWRSLIERYKEELPDFFAAKDDRARTHQLTTEAVVRLREAAQELRVGRLGAAALDRFLLNVAWIVGGRSQASGQRSSGVAIATELPAWLSRACAAIRDPGQFRQGVGAFYELCGRSPEHVARTTRRLLNRTVADLVNEARLEHAAAQLAWSDHRVLDIAIDCGLDLSHLHRLFRRRHGVSPGVYRRRQQQIVVAPSSRREGQT